MNAETSNRALFDFLTSELALFSTYHNHKEVMVNTAFAVQIAVFASILSQQKPFLTFNVLTVNVAFVITFIIYLLIWIQLHVYIKWQLTKKRVGALLVKAYQSALKEMASGLQINTSDIYLEGNDNSYDSVNWHNKVGDLLFKSTSQIVYYDFTTSGYPKQIHEHVMSSLNKGTTGEFHEKLICRASIFLLSLTLFKLITSTAF